jgi:TetR/AcrR family transcriptional regulator, repressor for neighboring sulfatase
VRRSPEQARALILAAAERLLAERGPDAVGLKDVARAAGVSHALVSHYFGTYEGLVEKALQSHTTRIRRELLARMSEASEVGPRAWIDQLFAALGHPLYGRLSAWAMLSGRFDREDFFPRRDQGLREVADAVEARCQALLGGLPFSREDIEFVMLFVMAAAYGYSLGRPVLWASLAHEATPERDAWFRARLATLVELTMLGGAGGPTRGR